jgi:hypothetical protein
METGSREISSEYESLVELFDLAGPRGLSNNGSKGFTNAFTGIHLDPHSALSLIQTPNALKSGKIHSHLSIWLKTRNMRKDRLFNK